MHAVGVWRSTVVLVDVAVEPTSTAFPVPFARLDHEPLHLAESSRRPNLEDGGTTPISTYPNHQPLSGGGVVRR